MMLWKVVVHLLVLLVWIDGVLSDGMGMDGMAMPHQSLTTTASSMTTDQSFGTKTVERAITHPPMMGSSSDDHEIADTEEDHGMHPMPTHESNGEPNMGMSAHDPMSSDDVTVAAVSTSGRQHYTESSDDGGLDTDNHGMHPMPTHDSHGDSPVTMAPHMGMSAHYPIPSDDVTVPTVLA